MDLRSVLFMVFIIASFNSSSSSNILGIFWTTSKSHYILGNYFLQALARRGHNVTLLSSFTDDTNMPNFKQIRLEGIVGTMDKLLSPNTSGIEQTTIFLSSVQRNSEKFWENEAVQQLIKYKEKYDVVLLMNPFNDGILGLPHHLEAPTIIFSPAGSSYMVNKFVANPNLPYATDRYVSKGTPDTFTGRLRSVIMNSIFCMMDKYYINPIHQEVLRKYLPNSPPISYLQKNVAMVLVNSHYSIESPRPYVPNMVPIGGFYAQSANKLPDHLQKFLDSAKDGAILFSFGTNMKIETMDKIKLNAILKGLEKVSPIKVLFKSEIDLSNISSNILVKKWLPQNDILAHPNVKAFVSHCGLGGVTESVFHGVPMLGIPLFGDQKTNIDNAKKSGYALSLSYEEITQETFSEALAEVLENPRYTKMAKKHSAVLRNQPVKPLDNAIWWVEHIIEHKGGEHLKNIAVDLEWYQMYMVDIVIFYLFVLLITLWFMCYILKIVASIVLKKIQIKYKKT